MNLKQYLFIFSVLVTQFLMVSCEDEVKEPTPLEKEDHTEDLIKTSEAAFRRHAEAQLRITGTEKYDLAIYKDQLNADDSIDYIITVNLLDRAKDNAIKENTTVSSASFGFRGRYNYFFFMDGASKNITSPIVVPSSAMAPLKVTFDNITSPAYKDIIIDYRIGNSCFRDYFSVHNKIPIMVSKADIFMNLGESDQEVFYIQHEPSDITIANNIVIYKGKAETPTFNDPDAIYKYSPTITKTDEIVRTWYFSPRHNKYYIPQD